MEKLCLSRKSFWHLQHWYYKVPEVNSVLILWPKREAYVRRFWLNSVVDVKPFFLFLPFPILLIIPTKSKELINISSHIAFPSRRVTLKKYSSFSIVKLLHFRTFPCTSYSLYGPEKRSIFMVSKCDKYFMLSFFFPLQGMRNCEL